MSLSPRPEMVSNVATSRRDRLFTPAPRGTPGLTAGRSAGRLLDVHRGGHCKPAYDLYYLKAPVAPLRPLDPVRANVKVVLSGKRPGMSRANLFPYLAPPLPEGGPRHGDELPRLFMCALTA